MNREQEVRKTIENFFRAMDNQDLELMKRLLPDHPSMVHVGTGRGEIWRGRRQLWEATLEQFESLEYYEATIYELEVHFSRDGTTAWYMHLLDANIKSGGAVTSWQGARFTGILEKGGEHWKMMQTHVSLPESAPASSLT